MSPETNVRVIYLSSFEYPTQHAHPLHAALMARALSRLYPGRFLFFAGDCLDASLGDIPMKTLGALAPVVRALRARRFVYLAWLFLYLLRHPSWHEDLTIVTNDLALASSLRFVRSVFPARLIVDVHGEAGERTEQALHAADRIVFVTPGLHERLAKGSAFEGKSIVRGNAVDAEAFRRADARGVRASLGIPDDAYVVGYSGRFRPMESDKGIGFMLEALATMPEDVHMLFVGGTDEEIALVAGNPAHAEALARVRFVPRIPQPLVPRYLAIADVLAYVPPRSDAFLAHDTSPMKLFEYQAAGKPLIVSDLPALRVATQGNAAAALIEPGDRDAFARAVASIRASFDELRVHVEAAAERMRENSWEDRAHTMLENVETPQQKKSYLRIGFESMFIATTGNLILKVFSALSTLLILHNLIPYDYGIWRLLLSATSTLGLVGLTGVTGMFTADIARELGEGRADSARLLLRSVTRFFIATGIVASIGLFVLAPVIARVSGIDLAGYLQVLSLTLIAAGFRQSYQIYFQAYLRPTATQVYQNSVTILYLIGIILFIGLMGLGVWGIVIAYTLSLTIPATLYAPAFFEHLRGRVTPGTPRYDFRKALFGRGRWALAEDYVSALANAAWPWITGYFLSIADVGIISVAMLLVSQVAALIPVQYVLRSILPRIANDANRVAEWLVRGIRYTLWSFVLVGLAEFVGVVIILPFVAPKYVSAIPLFGALLIALPFIATGGVLTEWFYAHKRQREFFNANAISGIAAIVLLPLFLIMLGVGGYILWYLAELLFTDLFMLWYVRRDEHTSIDLASVPWPDARDWELLDKVVARVRELLPV